MNLYEQRRSQDSVQRGPPHFVLPSRGDYFQPNIVADARQIAQVSMAAK
jgi:hypothetical protein